MGSSLIWEQFNFLILFCYYVSMLVCLMISLFTYLIRFKKIIPIPEQSMVQMLCYLLECLLTPESTPPDCAKEFYELYFVFAAVWAFGGALFQDQVLYGPMRGFTNHHDVSTKLSSQIKDWTVEEQIYVTLLSSEPFLSLEGFVKTGKGEGMCLKQQNIFFWTWIFFDYQLNFKSFYTTISLCEIAFESYL